MSLQARKELILSVSLRYNRSTKTAKQKILDEFTSATGYHRKYAILLLRQFKEKNTKPVVRRRTKKIKYNSEVQLVLTQVWETANRICSKRLVPFIPELVEVMERHGHLTISPEIKDRIFSITPATVDRLLAGIRRAEKPRGLSTTRSGSLLKGHVPIRTFADWNEQRPGFTEVDLVAHCGTSMAGSFLNTIVITDIATGWTEPLALPYRHQDTVLYALRISRKLLPFPFLGLDTDNGTEFLNRSLITYCRREEITFTRSRPYKKNDQCHVEQKNSAVVRRFIGYDRYEGFDACRSLSKLYQVLRLYVNFFQPSMKLISKHREDGKISRKYDQAQTPYQRVMASPYVQEQYKKELSRQYKNLDPVELMKQVESLQDQFWNFAYSIPQQSNTIAVVANDSVKKPAKHTSKIDEKTTLSVPVLSKSERMYRKTKRKGRYHLVKHTWRTRPDPFADVNDEIQEALILKPHLEAKTLFLELQNRYPRKFSDGQLRTLQRRVKDWRLKQLKEMAAEIGLVLSSEPENAMIPG